MALQEFERRLERLVEGVFAKAFRRGVTPIEVGRRITREMDVQRTVGVRGLIAPNKFTVALSKDDNDQLAGMANQMKGELAGLAREHAKQEGYSLVGPVEVDMVVDESLGRGEFLVASEMAESEDGGPAASIILGDGSRVRIGPEPVSLGRYPDNDIVLPEDEVSRHHAEVRRIEGGFHVVDLDSLNGTKVNGAGVTDRRLEDGDLIQIGAHTLRFELE
ncbi:MAG TPA: DUF3662 and FHA domain-containing protein [Acidimicrobiales bacterium]|jgi:hypothetical protein|nr:DUF3662 and FHA domain-containing protein [Acidimicrobiales bacterium]